MGLRPRAAIPSRLTTLMKTFAGILTALFHFTVAHSQFVVENVADGKNLYEQGEYFLAVEKFKDALAEEPQNGMIHYDLAMCYLAMNEFENALMAIDQAIALIEPDLKEMTIIVKGDILDKSGFREAAVNFYRKALLAYPESPQLLMNFGVALKNTGNIDAALENIEAALRQKFAEREAHWQLAQIHLERGDAVQASLAMYYFLLLENNTPRAEASASDLLQLIYERRSHHAAPARKSDARLKAALIAFEKMGAVASKDDMTARGAALRSSLKRFAEDTHGYFKALADIAAKNNAQGINADILQTYMTFFAALDRAGHTDALCAYIMQGGDNAEAREWRATNQHKVQALFAWYESSPTQGK